MTLAPTTSPVSTVYWPGGEGQVSDTHASLLVGFSCRNSLVVIAAVKEWKLDPSSAGKLIGCISVIGEWHPGPRHAMLCVKKIKKKARSNGSNAFTWVVGTGSSNEPVIELYGDQQSCIPAPRIVTYVMSHNEEYLRWRHAVFGMEETCKFEEMVCETDCMWMVPIIREALHHEGMTWQPDIQGNSKQKPSRDCLLTCVMNWCLKYSLSCSNVYLHLKCKGKYNVDTSTSI